MIATSQFISGDRLPPMNLEAEESVLGGILTYPESFSLVAKQLLPEHFALKSHQQIYKAIVAVSSLAKPPDLMQVLTYLHDRGLLDSIGGQSKLAQLVDCTISAINIDGYAELIIEKYQRRRLIQLGNEISSAGYETSAELSELLSWVQEQSFNTTQEALGGVKDSKAFKHQQIVSQVAKLELEEENPSLRYFKLIDIAKSSGLSVAQLETIYYKHLINDENEPAIPLAEFRQKYGASVSRWFLHGFLSEGKVSLFYGKGGVGKTRLIYDLIYSVAKGQSWNGFPVTAKSRKILLVQTDESQGDMIEALNARGVTDDLPILCKSRWTVDHIQQLKKEIVELGINWVVIDSLTAVSQNSIYSENDVPYARPILLLKALAQELGIHISIIHHAVSDGSKPRGTTAIVNAVSDVFCIAARCDAQKPDSLNRVLKVEKSRSRAPGIYDLLFDPEDNSWLLLGKQGEEEDSPNLTIKDRIISFLQSNPNISYEAAEIHEEIGGHLDSVRRCASQLARDGEVSAKRLPSGAKGYWIALDGDELPTHIPPDRVKIAKLKAEMKSADIEEGDRPDDHPMITSNDHPCDDGLASLSEIRRHPIIQSQEFSTTKSADIDDQMSADPENPHQKEVPGVIIKGDHQVIMGDRSDRPNPTSSSWIAIGNLVNYGSALAKIAGWEKGGREIYLEIDGQLLKNPVKADRLNPLVKAEEPPEEKRFEQLDLVDFLRDHPATDPDAIAPNDEPVITTSEPVVTTSSDEKNAIADFEVGDKVWVDEVLGGPAYSGEATITNIGNKYLALEIEGKPNSCTKSKARILSKADRTEAITSSSNEAIAPPPPTFHEGQKVRWNGCSCQIVKLWKIKAKIDGYNSETKDFVTQIVPIAELKES